MGLPQPLHIFRKDITHLWPETLVTVLLFAAFAWSAPSGWATSQYAGVATILAGFLKLFLMPISWLIVISRLIHDEPLVGDRQFWTSRPYHWANLLAAKVLFLLAFIYLPFLLMQVYLLKHAGLHPMLVIPALLHNLLLLTVIIVVPLTAISAVTSTFARMLLSTVGAVIYVVVVALGVLYLVFTRMPPPGLDYVFIALIILLPLISLVYQYATRKTTNARIMLAASPLLIVLLLFLTPATMLILHAYPVATDANGPKLGPLPDGLLPKEAPEGKLSVVRGDVQVQIPFTVAGVDDSSAYVVTGQSVTVTAPGVRWSTPYLNGFGQQITGGSPLSRTAIVMPVAVLNHIGDKPADVHLSIAATHLVADPPSTWKATLLPFSVPGNGICSYPPNDQDQDSAPVCRYPFKTPQLNILSAPISANCADPNAPKIVGRMSVGTGLSFLDFDPVVTTQLNFPNAGANGAPARMQLCPGTPLTFVEAKEQGKVRLEVDEKGIYLAPLAGRIAEKPVSAPGTAPQMQPEP